MTDAIIEIDGKLINCEQLDQLRQINRKADVESELARLRKVSNSIQRWLKFNQGKITQLEAQLKQMQQKEQEIFAKM